MSVANDLETKKLVKENKIIIDPYFEDFQGPNCYYCHLGNRYYKSKKSNEIIDISKTCDTNQYFELFENQNEIILKPGEFILTETFEYLGADNSHIIRLYNTTTLARWGIYHAGLGFVNAGCGDKNPIKLTLELVNLSKNDLRLKCTNIRNGIIDYGTEVLKICVVPLSAEAGMGYRGMYNGDKSVTLPKIKKYENEYRIDNNSLHNRRRS